MGQRLFKGRTDNHLTWVMVDSADFATPESAASAATTIKIYGKLRANDTVHFVSSGTGSLTNDIKHVGASVAGVYSIGLVKADLSDASAAWYDQYIVLLSCTGCARQTIVAEGVIDESTISGLISDAHSAAAQANSRVLLVQSRLSDFDSRLVSDISDIRSMLSDMQSDFQSRVPKAVATNSQLSDLHSDLRSFLVVMSGIQSDIYSGLSDLQSDFQSRVPKRVATDSQLSDVLSDLRSLITTTGVGVTSAAISDIASHVWAHTVGARVDSRVLVTQSGASDAASAAAQANSRILLVQSRLSDLDSRLVSDVSDILSGTRSLRSALIGHEGSTASAVNNTSVLEIDGIDHDDQFNGYYVKLLGGSQIDELRLIVDTDLTNSKITVKPAFNSLVASGIDFVIVKGDPVASRFHSDIQSRVSDVGSDLRSYLVGISGMLSDTYSAALIAQSGASDAHSAAAQANSRVLLVQSRLSDLDSRLVSDISDLRSQLSDVHSDLKSAIGDVSVTITASDISDIASAVVAALPITSMVSDIYSLLSDLNSNFHSRIPAEPASRSQVSDLVSDVKSAVTVVQSMASDAASAAQQGSSRILLVQSRVSDLDSRLASEFSDVYSLLSDFNSNFNSRVPKEPAARSQVSDLVSDVRSVLLGLSDTLSDFYSDFQSRVPKRVATDSQLSDVHSDLRSAIAGITAGVSASDISDIASAVRAGLISDLSDIHSAATAAASRALLNQSRISDVHSMVSDLYSDFQSRVPKRVATDSQVSDVLSDLRSLIGAGVELGASSLSDIRSAVLSLSGLISDAHSAAVQASSRALVVQSHASDIYSLLSDLHSDVAVMSGVVSDVYSHLQAGPEIGASSLSDLRSAITANGVLRAGAEPAAVIGHTDTVAAKVDWLAALSRNKITQTATVQSLRNDADNADIASAAVSDDGTTFVRGEFGN